MNLRKLVNQPVSMFLFDIMIVLLAKKQEIPNVVLMGLSGLLLYGTMNSYGMMFRIAILLGVILCLRYVSWEGFESGSMLSMDEEMELLSDIKSLVSSLNEPDSASSQLNEEVAV